MNSGPVTAGEIIEALSGGRPNSLGRAEEIVERLLDADAALVPLLDAYGTRDELVRLRVSSVLKRVDMARPDWTVAQLDRLVDEVAAIPQASVRWTVALVVERHVDDMNAGQRRGATVSLKTILDTDDDWLVQINTMTALAALAEQDEHLEAWLVPHLEARIGDHRKSIARRAQKLLASR